MKGGKERERKKEKDDKSIHFAQLHFLAYCVRFIGETASRYNRQRGITLLYYTGER